MNDLMSAGCTGCGRTLIASLNPRTARLSCARRHGQRRRRSVAHCRSVAQERPCDLLDINGWMLPSTTTCPKAGSFGRWRFRRGRSQQLPFADETFDAYSSPSDPQRTRVDSACPDHSPRAEAGARFSASNSRSRDAARRPHLRGIVVQRHSTRSGTSVASDAEPTPTSSSRSANSPKQAAFAGSISAGGFGSRADFRTLGGVAALASGWKLDGLPDGGLAAAFRFSTAAGWWSANRDQQALPGGPAFRPGSAWRAAGLLTGARPCAAAATGSPRR